jgi:hypothetical protein
MVYLLGLNTNEFFVGTGANLLTSFISFSDVPRAISLPQKPSMVMPWSQDEEDGGTDGRGGGRAEAGEGSSSQITPGEMLFRCMGELPAGWTGGTVTEGNKNCYQERTFLD